MKIKIRTTTIAQDANERKDGPYVEPKDVLASEELESGRRNGVANAKGPALEESLVPASAALEPPIG